ncbi:MAG: hypothetical protein ACO1TE_03640 [Prosthecobacter sp.]
MQRVEEELKLDMSWLNATARPARRKVNWISPVSWSALGAAAAVAVMSFLPAQPGGIYQSTATLAVVTPVSAPAAAVVPVASTTISEWDETKQADSRDKQAQYVRVSSRGDKQQAWLNYRDRARITLEYADAEKLALPVNFLSEAPFPLRDLPYTQ